MTSDRFAHLSDDDLGAVLAFVRSIPTVDRSVPERSLSVVCTVVFGVVGYGALPPAKVDHAAGPVTRPVEAVDATYGRYLTVVATGSDEDGHDLRGYQGPP